MWIFVLIIVHILCKYVYQTRQIHTLTNNNKQFKNLYKNAPFICAFVGLCLSGKKIKYFFLYCNIFFFHIASMYTLKSFTRWIISFLVGMKIGLFLFRHSFIFVLLFDLKLFLYYTFLLSIQMKIASFVVT